MAAPRWRVAGVGGGFHGRRRFLERGALLVFNFFMGGIGFLCGGEKEDLLACPVGYTTCSGVLVFDDQGGKKHSYPYWI